MGEETNVIFHYQFFKFWQYAIFLFLKSILGSFLLEKEQKKKKIVSFLCILAKSDADNKLIQLPYHCRLG